MWNAIKKFLCSRMCIFINFQSQYNHIISCFIFILNFILKTLNLFFCYFLYRRNMLIFSLHIWIGICSALDSLADQDAHLLFVFLRTLKHSPIFYSLSSCCDNTNNSNMAKNEQENKNSMNIIISFWMYEFTI